MDKNGPEWTTMVSIVVHPTPFNMNTCLMEQVVAAGY